MESYIVRRGDSLAKIAMNYYGDPSEWRRIFEANKSSISNPNQIRVGQRLNIPNTSIDSQKQRSMMSPEEQLRNPEPGITYPIELEVIELLVGATALLKGLLKAGVKIFSKKASTKVDDVFKSVINPKTGKKEWPNSPYVDKSRDPRHIQADINKKIQEDMKSINPNDIGRQNAEIERIHKEFIETGKWPKRKDLGDYHISSPGPGLIKARQEFLKALNEHK